jgi:CBS domain-containing protein
MQHYKLIEIFTDEEARWQGEPLPSATIQFIHDLKIAARCLVTRGIAGSYESGEIATSGLEVLSYNMPVWIKIILPAFESDLVLAEIEKMVTNGIVTVQDLNVVSHRTPGLLMPRQTRVRDVMTTAIKKVNLEKPLDEVARLLLSSTFTGLPVVDSENRPVGIISQSDLIYKAGMPMRLGLLAESERERVDAVLKALGPRQASEVMTRPAVTIGQDKLVTEAVQLMLKKQVKRLPVVDDNGKMVGNISRVDVFHTILRECPDWQAFQKHEIKVENLRLVSDIMRRDTTTVLADTPVEELIRLIDCNDIQRICVIDQEGNFLGLISDRDLLVAFADRHPGIWDYFVSKVPFTERGRQYKQLQEHLRKKTAGEVMKTDIVTIQEDAPIDAAIWLMLEGTFKRLPVVDSQGKFKGIVSREALLRGGFASASGKAD